MNWDDMANVTMDEVTIEDGKEYYFSEEYPKIVAKYQEYCVWADNPVVTLVYGDGSREQFVLSPGSHWEDRVQRVIKKRGVVTQIRQFIVVDRAKMIYEEKG